MPKVNLNSKEYLEDSYPKRDKVTKWKFDWHTNNNLYNKTKHLKRFIDSQVDKPFDDTYKEVCKRLKEDKSLKAINRSPYLINSWFIPESLQWDSTGDHRITSRWRGRYLWADKVYINTDGILRNGAFFENVNSYKDMIRGLCAYPKNANYYKELAQKKKEARRIKAIERYCQKSDVVINGFLRPLIAARVPIFNRSYYYIETSVYKELVRRLEGLNEFYDIPYRLRDNNGNLYTNVTYKRYMK